MAAAAAAFEYPLLVVVMLRGTVTVTVTVIVVIVVVGEEMRFGGIIAVVVVGMCAVIGVVAETIFVVKLAGNSLVVAAAAVEVFEVVSSTVGGV